MYTRAVLCRPNLGIRVLGGEEHIARGRECLYKLQYASRPTDGTLVRTEARMRPLAFLGSLSRARQQVSIFPARGHWNRSGKVPLAGRSYCSSSLPTASVPHTHILQIYSDVHSMQPYVLTKRGF